MNRDRIPARRKAWDDGEWVREAALAHAAKRRARKGGGGIMNTHIAELNVAYRKYELNDPRFAGFVNNLERINALRRSLARFCLAAQG